MASYKASVPHRFQVSNRGCRNSALLIADKCASRCAEWLPSPTALRCPQHEYLDYPETKQMVEYLDSHDQSSSFKRWATTRNRAETDPNILKCFYRRPNTEDVHKEAKRWDSCQENIVPLFNRFLRYAADIDNGVHYVQRAKEICQTQGSFKFLDMGFAPGGMSELLLDADSRITGAGITLGAGNGGNVYHEYLCNNSRYAVIEADILKISQHPDGLSGFMSVPEGGFDLIIAGITISGSHQAEESEHVNLKDRLHIIQLALAMRHLRPGGILLVRMHLSIRLLEMQMLGLLIKCHEKETITKPLTEFAMRKTFWILFENFVPDATLSKRLQTICTQVGALENDLLGIGIDAFLQQFGSRLIATLSPVWKKQSDVLEWIMSGKRDRLCGKCRATSSVCRYCLSVVFPDVVRAVGDVMSRLKNTNRPLLL
uniref:Ribosomal RNA methyltransferase FtsJ domain-containing protein n=1 Tax=Spongospora subterranea TaxID=70186 RepID=A0A0H5R7N3_9EUKA|eukprot:CRZ10133.1 hypothetical protein [Spongospora subterranea]